MNLKFTFSFFFIFISCSLFAQEIPFYKQYLFNNFLINPAFSGLEDYTPITLLDKHQWIGQEDAPAVQSFTLTGKLKKEGYGIGVFNDKAGRFSTQSMQFSFSHHIIIGKYKKFKKSTGRIVRERPELSFGVTFAAYRLNLDERGLKTVYYDPAISDKMETASFPDANFGIYYQKKGGFVSLSAQNLFSATINLYNRDTEYNKLIRQYFFFFGKEVNVDKMLTVEPSVLFKANESKQFSMDFNLRFIYLDDYWFAISYSRDVNNLLDQNHSLKFYAGVKIFHAFHTAYAYEQSFNGLQLNTYGTHEFMLKYNLFQEKKRHYFY